MLRTLDYLTINPLVMSHPFNKDTLISPKVSGIERFYCITSTTKDLIRTQFGLDIVLLIKDSLK